MSSAPSTPKITESASQPVASRGVGVLSIGEAAARLGMSRSQLEAMIDRDTVKVLPTGCTGMIPTTEVERLLQTRGQG
jgi:hypothetical protein